MELQRGDMIQTDRLSGLADDTLHKILSLLDTKIAVQTSILSKRWRHVWKEVPSLNFFRSSFKTKLGLVQFVDRVLLLRSTRCGVFRINTHFRVETMKGSFDRILKYAASHGIQRLSVLRFETEERTIGPRSIASISICYRSLTILDLQFGALEHMAFDSLSRLKLLKSMSLTMCTFLYEEDGTADPFANFVKLENLKLVHCSRGVECADRKAVVKITGRQLLTLEIHESFGAVEIFAPKLESFYYSAEICPGNWVASELDLPSLQHATVNLWCRTYLQDIEYDPELLRQCVNFFQSLHNAKCLTIHLDTNKLLSRVCDLLRDQHSPFNRLKFLHFTYCEGVFGIPCHAIRYFLEGAADVENKVVVDEKVPIWYAPTCCPHLLFNGNQLYNVTDDLE